MRQAIIWTNADPIHWRIYGALGGMSIKDVIFETHQMNTT